MLDYVFAPSSLHTLGRGALLTVELAVGALALGVVLGVIGAMGRISRYRLPRWLAAAYVEFIRGTPMLLQIMFLFIGVPMLYKMFTGTHININPLVVGLLAMGINSGAYNTELIRAGIQGVDKGQMEAARSLGLSYGRAMRHVILPQAFKRIIPPPGQRVHRANQGFLPGFHHRRPGAYGGRPGLGNPVLQPSALPPSGFRNLSLPDHERVHPGPPAGKEVERQ